MGFFHPNTHEGSWFMGKQAKRKWGTRLLLENLERRDTPSGNPVFYVDDDYTGGESGFGVTKFDTIQSAIDAAADGTKIRVKDGTYEETLDFIGKNNIKLLGKNYDGIADNTIIKAPAASGEFAVIDVAGANNIFIKGFVIDGTQDTSLFAGVLVSTIVGDADGIGSATIKDNKIKMLNNPEDNTSTAFGVQVGDFDGTNSLPGKAKILWNDISHYGKSGILVQELGSNAKIWGNDITGSVGSSAQQNGIDIFFDASADIAYNDITGNDSQGGVPGAAGILIEFVEFAEKPTTVYRNDVFGNEGGIVLDNADGHKIFNNDVYSNTANGIELFQSDGNDVAYNWVSDNGFFNGQPNGSGINLTGSNGNWVRGNKTVSNGGDGITLVNSNGNDLFFDFSAFNDFDGFALDNSDNNIIKFNTSLGNQGSGFSFLNDSTGNIVKANVSVFNELGITTDATSGMDVNTFEGNIVFGNEDDYFEEEVGASGIATDYSLATEGIAIDASTDPLTETVDESDDPEA